jgi:hypothetical protein
VVAATVASLLVRASPWPAAVLIAVGLALLAVTAVNCARATRPSTGPIQPVTLGPAQTGRSVTSSAGPVRLAQLVTPGPALTSRSVTSSRGPILAELVTVEPPLTGRSVTSSIRSVVGRRG